MPSRDGPTGRPAIRPLDQAIHALRPVTTRAVPEPTSLSERAARLLANGPMPAQELMRVVCRMDRVRAESAERIADVLLGSRPEFVQLDDDRWALLVDGRAVLHAQDAAPSHATDGDPASSAVYGTPAVGATSFGTVGSSMSTHPGASAAMRAEPLGPQQLRDIRFAVVDVETTGSQPGRDDRITEIAIVPVEGLRVGEPWQTLVHPGRAIPPFISALTGITNEMVAGAPRFHEVADEVCARLDGTVFVAHNASFDRRFVECELARTLRTQLVGVSLCTVRLSRRLVPSLPRRSLDRVCEHFRIAIHDRHRAGGDALATAHVLVHLLGVAAESGIETWPQLERYLSGPTRRTRRPLAFPTSAREDTSA